MRYFSGFSGIGAVEIGIHEVYPDAECVGYAEINKYAKAIYSYHFPTHKNYGDITTIDVRELPDFDLFVGGFPCQSFSIAGKRLGFDDTRGTLFFDVARILEAKRPEWVLLENVKGILSHGRGATLATIYGVLTDLGYTVGWEVVNSCKFRVPQSRERIYIVGHLTACGGRVREILPVQTERGEIDKTGGGITSTALDANYFKGIDNHGQRTAIMTVGTLRTHKDGEGFREVSHGLCPTIPARARNDGSGQPVMMIKAVLTPDRPVKRQNGRRFKDHNEPSFTLTAQDKHGVMIEEVPHFITKPDEISRTLRTGGDSTLTAKHNYDHIYDGAYIRRFTPIETERLQGFPDSWTSKGIMDGKIVDISDTQRYKCCGNAVTTTVVEAFIKRIKETKG